MKKKSHKLFLVLAFFFSFFSFEKTFASDIYHFNFDTGYTTGNLNGQNGWSVTLGTVDVGNSQAYEGTQAIFINTANSARAEWDITNYTASSSNIVYQQIAFYLASGTSGSACISPQDSGTCLVKISATSTGSVVISDASGGFLSQEYEEDTWHVLQIKYELTEGNISYSVDGEFFNQFVYTGSLHSITYMSVNRASSGNAVIWLDEYKLTTDELPPLLDYSTHIINFTPLEDLDGPWLDGTEEIEFSLDAYINEEDIGSVVGIEFTLHNINQNGLLANLAQDDDIYFLDSFHATSSGYFHYSTTTIIAPGNYRINAILTKSYLGGFIENPFSDVSEDLSHQFCVATSTDATTYTQCGTFIGNISQNSFSQINDFLNSANATSTTNLAKTCYPFSGQFDTISCLSFLFIPDSAYLNNTILEFKNKIFVHFPLGYITDFVGIITSTTTRPLVIIDATIPSVLPGGGANVTLDISHGFDFILNATTSIYNNESASSTGTLYEITSPYWDKFLYICAFLYILGRILGKNLIPNHEKF